MNTFFPELTSVCPEEEFAFHYPLGVRSTLKAGGTAVCVFSPRSLESLAAFRQWNRAQEKPHTETVLGSLSNVLIRDGGLDGVVIRLSKLPAEAQFGDEYAIFSAGMRNLTASQKAMDEGWTGLEILSCIPGTLGGAVVMNAGADGWDISQSLQWIEVLNAEGDVLRLDRQSLKMVYRDGGIAPGWIVLRVALRLRKDSIDKIRNRQLRCVKKRRRKIRIPLECGTAGSTFKNPDKDTKAWALIDSVGGRGLRRGGAMMSEEHANYILNVKNATAEDLELLGEEIRRRVYETHGILLEWEIRILGKKAPEHDDVSSLA